MKNVTRRQFLRWVTVSTGGALAAQALSACGVSSPGVSTTGSPVAGATPRAETLRNENVPGFFVRYFKPFPAPDPNAWRLSVEGLAGRPQTLSLDDVQRLTSVTETRRLKCVECWSARATWEGFDLDALVDLTDPEPESRWLHFFCADGYYESLSLEELRQDGVLFAYSMNGELLPSKYGSPLRLVIPSKYGYKWPKAIVRLEFAKDEKVGYWPTVGPYTSSGAILAGRDSPLDLPGGARPIDGGEVRYPEDLEAGQNQS